MIMKFFVEYNAQYMAMYKSVKACLNLINRKGWKNDEDNMLRIVDENGDEYDTITGAFIEEEYYDVRELTVKEMDVLIDLINDNPDMTINPSETKMGVVVLRFPKTNGFFMCLKSDYEKAVDYINDPSIEL